jgi:hypothetical protein
MQNGLSRTFGEPRRSILSELVVDFRVTVHPALTALALRTYRT